jgi:YVTN family beta-propeller protein
VDRERPASEGHLACPSTTVTPTASPTAAATKPATPASTPIAPPTLPGRAYVANQDSNNVTVLDTTSVLAVDGPIPVGANSLAVGIGP